jgi:hypothetical protein
MHKSILLISLFFLLATSLHGRDLYVIYDGEIGTDAWHGLEQGIAEANTQGKFLGLTYLIAHIQDAVDIKDNANTVIVSTRSNLTVTKVAYNYPTIPIFAILPDQPDTVRPCVKNILYTLPSADIISKVTKLWRTNTTESRGHAQAWHFTFKKYAAAQLNKRFTKATGKPMTDESWAAWAAVKLFSDIAARSPAPSKLLLKQDEINNLAFDGQKGVDLNFNSTRELLQPLLIVENNKIISELDLETLNKLRDTNSKMCTN